VLFRSHRNYVVGDDLRFLDWNVYARLEKLFIKLFLEEVDLHVNILVDVSKSMAWGTPDKSRYARQMAAALAYVGLANNDRVSIYCFSDGIVGELSGLRGKRTLPKALDLLQDSRTKRVHAQVQQPAIRTIDHPAGIARIRDQAS